MTRAFKEVSFRPVQLLGSRAAIRSIIFSDFITLSGIPKGFGLLSTVGIRMKRRSMGILSVFVALG